MCGIVALFDTHSRRNYSQELINKLNDIQTHRGPDESGIHIEPGVALGHRRLSVIDLATGSQPIFNETGSVCVVFNGEIYNYQELVAELQQLGHIFRTRSDTEVIVHAWEAWGKTCVKRFRGMFAFALWDRNQKTFFIARDRMGVKPLHYALFDDGTFIVGSELKVITTHPKFQRRIDPLAIEEYFALGYVADPRCIYIGAHKLPPAHTLMLRHGYPVPQPEAYWDINFTCDNPINIKDASAELLERIDEAVRLRMIADVPLGAFLSGGVDSSAVVATMAKISNSPVRTCAIGFRDPAFDESEFALLVANLYKTDHHLNIVDSEDFDLIDTLAWLHDEPFADNSSIPTYRVCQLTRQNVTVALSGDGGDESFGGYRRYRMHIKEEGVRNAIPLKIRRPLFGTLGRLYPKADWAPRNFRAKSTLQAMALDTIDAYLHSVGILRQDERDHLFSPELKHQLYGYTALEVFRHHANNANTNDPLALIQYVDYKTWLVGDINTKVDRASMAHSLEVREPLMDHKLVEWLATLPSCLKIRGQEGKFLLKKAFEPLLPANILYRQKMGFSMPSARWLRGSLAERAREALLGKTLTESGYFNTTTIRFMLDKHQSGQRDFSAPLWSLLMFEAFLRNTEKLAAKQ